MKVKYLIIVFIIIIVGGILFMIFKKNNIKNVEIGDIEYFSMFYTKGYMINSDIRYKVELDQEKEKFYITIKPYGEEKEFIVEEPNGFRDKIKDILVKYEVNKWNGFNESDHGVLDGDSFSINIKFSNDESIDASGYMSWPTNYRNVRDKIDEIFMEIYNKA